MASTLARQHKETKRPMWQCGAQQQKSSGAIRSFSKIPIQLVLNLGVCLRDHLLDLERLSRKLLVFGFGKERVQTTTVVDST